MGWGETDGHTRRRRRQEKTETGERGAQTLGNKRKRQYILDLQFGVDDATVQVPMTQKGRI
jgi:hypothetical protein